MHKKAAPKYGNQIELNMEPVNFTSCLNMEINVVIIKVKEHGI